MPREIVSDQPSRSPRPRPNGVFVVVVYGALALAYTAAAAPLAVGASFVIPELAAWSLPARIGLFAGLLGVCIGCVVVLWKVRHRVVPKSVRDWSHAGGPLGQWFDNVPVASESAGGDRR